MGLVDKRCRSCKYVTELSYKDIKYCCNYIEIMNEPRGCEAGKNCTKYKRGKQQKIKRNIAFSYKYIASPCKNCSDRIAPTKEDKGCRATCKKYKDYEKRKKKLYEKIKADEEYHGYLSSKSKGQR